MTELEGLFKSAQERMTPVEGFDGVYTISNPPATNPPQTLDGLQITPVDVPPAGV